MIALQLRGFPAWKYGENFLEAALRQIAGFRLSAGEEPRGKPEQAQKVKTRMQPRWQNGEGGMDGRRDRGGHPSDRPGTRARHVGNSAASTRLEQDTAVLPLSSPRISCIRRRFDPSAKTPLDDILAGPRGWRLDSTLRFLKRLSDVDYRLAQTGARERLCFEAG
jgi:hypothetical protein